jgi:hypothetical protein
MTLWGWGRVLGVGVLGCWMEETSQIGFTASLAHLLLALIVRNEMQLCP